MRLIGVSFVPRPSCVGGATSLALAYSTGSATRAPCLYALGMPAPFKMYLEIGHGGGVERTDPDALERSAPMMMIHSCCERADASPRARAFILSPDM